MTLNFSSLVARREELREATQFFANAGARKLFPLDFLAWAAANRSLGLIAGFEALITAENYSTAAAVLRLQLDTGLRFMASFHVSAPHEFAMKVLKGERIDRQKDRNGKRLTDRYLVTLALAEEPWIERVYEATSGFVHLSERHIFGAIDGLPSDFKMTFKLSEKDSPAVTRAHRQEAIDAFAAAVGILLRYLVGWGATKNLAESRSSEA